MKPYNITQTEARERLKGLGYQLRKTDGEFEIYPKGQRGALSYFTDDLQDAIDTARAETTQRFTVAVRNVAHPQFHQHHREALITWHGRHGAQWRDELLSAWYTGNYGFSFANRAENVDGNLQQLRNTCGREILDLLVNV